MENHFEICMTEDQLRGISSIGLARMGRIFSAQAA